MTYAEYLISLPAKADREETEQEIQKGEEKYKTLPWECANCLTLNPATSATCSACPQLQPLVRRRLQPHGSGQVIFMCVCLSIFCCCFAGELRMCECITNLLLGFVLCLCGHASFSGRRLSRCDNQPL
jgi:hypothetical protein